MGIFSRLFHGFLQAFANDVESIGGAVGAVAFHILNGLAAVNGKGGFLDRLG